MQAGRAFIELALCIFPARGVLSRLSGGGARSIHMPIRWTCWRAVSTRKPGIVTSGTGSGKTEAFMLPILAAISAEAVKWPRPSSGYLKDRWWETNPEHFRSRRARTFQALQGRSGPRALPDERVGRGSADPLAPNVEFG